MNALLSWWDGVELWLSGRGFILQTIIVMPMVLALAHGIAVVGDRFLYYLLTVVNRLGWFDTARRDVAAEVPADGAVHVP